MKKIIIILILIALYACKSSEEPVFLLDPSKPVEIGIESIKDDNSNLLINVYMINHQPVSGIQFEIEPKDFFEVDSVFGGRCEQNNFKLYNNKKGKILGFSIKGDQFREWIAASYLYPYLGLSTKSSALKESLAEAGLFIRKRGTLNAGPVVATKQKRNQLFRPQSKSKAQRQSWTRIFLLAHSLRQNR